ncbi:threonylcarbamoyl-AMP synthase [Janibacter sp. YIM B02568]|jgi:tRNA threonylcarbamoyl adenosine modification protein (Sua5/YciO/YrdC/YwlC family)|uniref:L-threonylcarbamoyladenylate synthase n=1 Tax=Janibacter endophyticus TaxID=2806261 RepID=UPI00194F260F|nr:L-threonylcarbamoyladenylate synthase [Janibacter endophyticus]MBM6546363.1 threonylcarbamoyl-AMP synthase [Janibacter endophyticus]
MATFVEVHPDNPQARTIAQVAQRIREGALVAFPTDSGYALGGRLDDQAIKDRIRDIRRLDDKHHYTLLCRDFAQLGQLVHVDNHMFRAIRAATPGPYTFILPATKEVPRRLLHAKKKTVGVRIPDHPVVQALLEELGEPLLSSTLLLPGHEETPVFGWDVKEELDHAVDIVIDAGEVSTAPTTVIDYSSGTAEVARHGAGDADPFEG